MELRTLYRIYNLRFDSPAHCTFGAFKLSNDQAVRESFYTPDFLERFGRISIETDKSLVFGYSFHVSNDDESTGFNPHEVMHDELTQMSAFMSFLWMVKDNSAYGSSASAVRISGNEKLYHHLAFGGHAWNQHGKTEPATYSQKEVRAADELAMKYLSLRQEKSHSFADYGIDKEVTSAAFGISPSFQHNELNSVERAMMFLANARGISHMPYRVAMYMPVFECLFSTDGQEVTHKVCERVAFYLRESPSERKTMYSDLKDAYNFRSKYLHGSKFPKGLLKNSEPERLAVIVDNIAREVFNGVLMRDSDLFVEKVDGKAEEQRQRDLNDMIFG